MTRRGLDVAGIGSMVVDRLYRVSRIVAAEEKGRLLPVEGGELSKHAVGGVVLNHLGWAALLGLRAGIFGKQADDENGRWLRAGMQALGIETNLVLDGSASSLADIFIDDTGARAIYFAPGATAEVTAEHVRAHHADFIRRAVRVTTEIHQLPLPAVHEVLRIAREAGISTLLDVDMPPSRAVPDLGDRALLEDCLRGAAILKPSKAAARELSPETGDDVLAAARALRARYSAEAVVVTDGAAGCAVAARDFEGLLPAYPIKTVDTTGAGDAFTGGLLAALQRGLPWRDAGRLANACGAACAEQVGAFPENPRRLRARVLELYDGTSFEIGPEPAFEAPTAVTAAAAAFATFDTALEELSQLRRRMDVAAFAVAVDLIQKAVARGARVHATGVGKSEHVARYAAGMLASTGTPAVFLPATEAVHGSAGQVVAGDVVIAISNSGETAELTTAVETVQALGALLIAVTGRRTSPLARAAEIVLDAGVKREGGPLGLAPRASVAAQVLTVAALSAELERACAFTRADYHARHPAGRLGRASQLKAPRTPRRGPRPAPTV